MNKALGYVPAIIAVGVDQAGSVRITGWKQDPTYYVRPDPTRAGRGSARIIAAPFNGSTFGVKGLPNVPSDEKMEEGNFRDDSTASFRCVGDEQSLLRERV
jgi:hypothetical protein